MSFIPLTPSGGPDFTVAQDYLSARGIDKADVQRFGLEIVSHRSLPRELQIQHDTRLAILIPYHDVHGVRTDYAVCRYVGHVPTWMTEPIKLRTPKNRIPQAYFPLGTTITKGARVYFHESCIKALAGFLVEPAGIHVGLNGVQGFGAMRKHKIPLLLDIVQLPWAEMELRPFIVFDSNYSYNPDVATAIATLAARINEVSKIQCRHLPLPDAPEEWLAPLRVADPEKSDWGFDDFRVYGGDSQALEYLHGDGVTIEPIGAEALKHELNGKVVYVRELDRVVELETGMIMSREAFHSGVYAQYVIPNGARPIRVAKDWLDWPLRSQVTKIDYLPGVDSGVVDSAYNKWPGWGVDSMAGDVTPWLELTELQIPDAALRHEFTCMLAWPLQNPGKKMTKFCHLWGPPGTGKNAVLVPLMFIYGRNGIILGKDDITRDFQDLIPFRQMIVFDELHPGDKQSAVRLMNKLKPFITGASLMINPKGMPQFEIANRMNVVTLSNYADGIRLDDGDRRAFVLGFTNLARKGDKDWWDSYYAWAGDPAGDPGPGCAALMDYLMGYDTSSFDPHGEAMMTDDKALITVAARNGLEQWVMQLAEDPELVLTPVMRGVVLVENDELARFAFADEQHVTGGMKVQLGLAMLGTFKRTCQIKVGGKPRRFWIIRRKGEEWDDNDKIRGQLKLQQFPGAK